MVVWQKPRGEGTSHQVVWKWPDRQRELWYRCEEGEETCPEQRPGGGAVSQVVEEAFGKRVKDKGRLFFVKQEFPRAQGKPLADWLLLTTT